MIQESESITTKLATELEANKFIIDMLEHKPYNPPTPSNLKPKLDYLNINPTPPTTHPRHQTLNPNLDYLKALRPQ